MPSARGEKTVMHGVPDHMAKIDGCDLARRPGALPVRLPGRDESRQVISLGDPTSNETEHDLVPAIGPEPDEGASCIERALSKRKRFATHLLLNLLAPGVEPFGLARDRARIALVVTSEQLGAEA